MLVRGTARRRRIGAALSAGYKGRCRHEAHQKQNVPTAGCQHRSTPIEVEMRSIPLSAARPRVTFDTGLAAPVEKSLRARSLLELKGGEIGEPTLPTA